MSKFEGEFRVAASCGGSGGIPIIDALLDITPNVTSITGVFDNGGHSGEIRSTLGLLPPGDATHQIAVHIRNPRIRQLFIKRWALSEDHKLNGHRPGNEFLAAAEDEVGSHSGGIKLLEEAFQAWYKGRVIPISNDDIQLRIHLSDGTYKDGESYIDNMTLNDPSIRRIEFIPQPPRPNPEAIETIANADLIIPLMGTWFGSQLPILQSPMVKEAILASKAPIAWFCNAVTTPETNGYTASKFAEQLANVLGREIDFAFINKMSHNLPENYAKSDSFAVESDLRPSNPFIKKIYELPLTRLEFIEGRLVVRHDGTASCRALIEALKAA